MAGSITSMKNRRNSWIAVPPGIILGAVIVLVPIFFFWTVQNIRKQREIMTLLLLEKGAALIRSFEAGTRTGMMGMMGGRGGGFQLQRLLVETAQQQDIVHLLVTDTEGNILAHSDSQRIGSSYGTDLDLETLSRMEQPQWRRVRGPYENEFFEVFRRFNPVQPYRRGWSGRMSQGMWPFDQSQQQWAPERKLVIFVGLDMGAVEEAGRRDERQRVLTAVVLLLIGFAGIVLLFLAQAYRTTRTSLTRIKAFSENVVEGMPIGLIAVDSVGSVVSVNHAAETILEIDSASISGKPGAEVLPPPLWELVGNPVPRKKRALEKEIECNTDKGRVVPLEVSVSTLEGEETDFLGHLILFRDLTEVRSLQREIETGRRLASLGRLAAGIAHEIRNPLSSIKGFATYFKEKYRDMPEDRGTAEIMVQEVERLNRVISQLLEFARPTNIHRKPSSAQAVIQHSVHMIRRQAVEKDIRVVTHLPENIPEVPMDPDKVNQVLLNLYLNSLEAMESGGTLSVDLRTSADRPGIEISVGDTGIGIRKEDLAQIFEPYFTTRQSGTGLGLAIVHNIMEAHRGDVRVESEPGKGTTVTLYFPEDSSRVKRDNLVIERTG
jgi:two-component system sensor histidine kinase HydH